MEKILENIDLKNIDKSNWESHGFEKIASSISERVEPTQTDLETYVGLEHLDPEDIHIRRFGKREDVSGTKLRCYPGDVIFGRRRAYQRKAAVVNFDGFCSAHSLVLRPNPKVIDPQLFPFFLHSDQFMHRAVDISVGSLSPTINWGTLKKEKFLLPPKDQQARLASLLWALDEVMEREREVLEGLERARQSFFSEKIKKYAGKKTPLSKLLIAKKKKSQVPHQREKYIGLEHIKSGKFECDSFRNSSEVLAQCNMIDTGDLCYSKLRPYLDKAFIAEFDAVSTTELLVFDTKSVSKEYVLYHMHSKPFIDFVNGKTFGTRMPRASIQIIGDYEIKVLEDEDKLIDELSMFTKGINEIKTKLVTSKSLQKSLINQIF